jgi:hypothetical protein
VDHFPTYQATLLIKQKQNGTFYPGKESNWYEFMASGRGITS